MDSEISSGFLNKIVGKVIDLTNLKKKNGNSGDEYFTFNFALKSCIMPAVCFHSDKYVNLKNDENYEIGPVLVKYNDYLKMDQIKIQPNTLFTPIEEQIEYCKHDPVTEINNVIQGTVATICGVCIYIGPSEQKNVKRINMDASVTTLRSIIIQDKTAKIKVNTWREHFEVEQNEVVLAEKVKITDYLGTLEATATSTSKITINPDEFRSLSEWYTENVSIDLDYPKHQNDEVTVTSMKRQISEDTEYTNKRIRLIDEEIQKLQHEKNDLITKRKRLENENKML